jgi:hypothetical protein
MSNSLIYVFYLYKLKKRSGKLRLMAPFAAQAANR